MKDQMEARLFMTGSLPYAFHTVFFFQAQIGWCLKTEALRNFFPNEVMYPSGLYAPRGFAAEKSCKSFGGLKLAPHCNRAAYSLFPAALG